MSKHFSDQNLFQIRSDKKQKIFFNTPLSKFQKFQHQTSAMEQSRFTQRKKEILRKDTLRISAAAVGKCTVKKLSLKNSPPVYWHITKTHDIHHVQNP